MRERLEGWRDDLRYAIRALRRAPRFTLAALLSLALGLGATTAIFSVVDHVVLRPLPYADADRLVVVREIVGAVRETYPTMPANASHALAWQAGCLECDAIALLRGRDLVLSGDGDPQRVGTMRVTANIFGMLGTRAALGRTFVGAEELEGAARVAVLSDGFWRRQFGGDPGVIGRTIRLGDASWEVVGVLPEDFALPSGRDLGLLDRAGSRAEILVPLRLSERERRTPGEFDYGVIARLRPGVTIEGVRRRIAGIQAELARSAPPGIGSLDAEVAPLRAHIVRDVRRPFVLLLGAVGAMLLIVCANLAHLTLARDAGRRRETSVRAALGAGSGRLARLALLESVVLALAGGLLGLAVALAGVRVLVVLAPADLPRLDTVSIDARVLAVSMTVATLVGIAVGLWPALRLARTTPASVLREGGRGASGGKVASRRRATFIGAQVALSTVMLLVTGLLLTSFVRVLGVDRGFTATETLALDVQLPADVNGDAARRSAMLERMRTEVARIAGVSAVSPTNGVPLEGDTQVDRIALPGDDDASAARLTANIRYVSPSYFAAMGTPLRRGRAFAETDRGRAVVVISERTARALFPAGDAIGRTIIPGSNDPAAEVVGIVADERMAGLEQSPTLVAYLPSWSPGTYASTLLVRGTVDAASLTAQVRATLRALEPRLVVGSARTMRDVVSRSVAPRRFQLALLGVLAVLALATASIGIYGVIAHSLSLRTRELGTRMALGASPAAVRRLVLVEGMRPVLAGLVVGIAAAVAMGRLVAGLLYEVEPTDPATLVAVAAVLGAVALLACLLPATRAGRGDLVGMLRAE